MHFMAVFSAGNRGTIISRRSKNASWCRCSYGGQELALWY